MYRVTITHCIIHCIITLLQYTCIVKSPIHDKYRILKRRESKCAPFDFRGQVSPDKLQVNRAIQKYVEEQSPAWKQRGRTFT